MIPPSLSMGGAIGGSVDWTWVGSVAAPALPEFPRCSLRPIPEVPRISPLANAATAIPRTILIATLLYRSLELASKLDSLNKRGLRRNRSARKNQTACRSGDITIMFLFALFVQDPITFAELKLGWHDDILAFARNELPRLVFILLFAFVLTRIVDFFVKRMRRLADTQVERPQRGSELRTLASILRATAYGIVGFIVLLHVLKILKIDYTPYLASAGVIGVGIGLGAQSLFKDIINGIFILVENQFNVGDTVKIASLTGTVEDLSLRLTTLRDGDGTLYFIPNSQIATVSNQSRDFSVASLNMVVDASADPDKVLEILRSVCAGVRKDAAVNTVILSDPSVPGIDSISGRAVTYPITFQVKINQKDAVLRELRRRILQAFEENSIPLGTDPANLLLHPRPDPTAPPAQQPLTSA